MFLRYAQSKSNLLLMKEVRDVKIHWLMVLMFATAFGQVFGGVDKSGRVGVKKCTDTFAFSRVHNTKTDDPHLNRAIRFSSLTLFGDDIEYPEIAAFGKRADLAAAEKFDTQYIDQEFDGLSGFNCMKGRFQLPDQAKFNRPDPMRDWSWLQPHSINLYEYVGNDPINAWGPTGFEFNVLDLEDHNLDLMLDELSQITGYTRDFKTTDDGSTIPLGIYVDDDGNVQVAENAAFEDGS